MGNKEVTVSFRIMRKHLHDIVRGVKPYEYRDLSKFNVERTMNLDRKGDIVSFKNIVALRLYVGNEKDCEFAVVRVDDYGDCIHQKDNLEGHEEGPQQIFFKLGEVIETNVYL